MYELEFILALYQIQNRSMNRSMSRVYTGLGLRGQSTFFQKGTIFLVKGRYEKTVKTIFGFIFQKFIECPRVL